MNSAGMVQGYETVDVRDELRMSPLRDARAERDIGNLVKRQRGPALPGPSKFGAIESGVNSRERLPVHLLEPGFERRTGPFSGRFGGGEDDGSLLSLPGDGQRLGDVAQVDAGTVAIAELEVQPKA